MHQGAWAEAKDTSQREGRQPDIKGCKEKAKSDLSFTAEVDEKKGEILWSNMHESQQGRNPTQ